MIRLGILGSTRGTNMLRIIQAINEQQLAARIELVLSNKEEALILARAREHQIPAEYVSPHTLSRVDYDLKLNARLEAAQVDLVVLIGYMRILSAEFVSQWPNAIINVHPSLLPNFSGLMDLAVHQAVLDAGHQETGCTVHVVTAEVDAGPIILQKRCAVQPGDTAERLKERVQGLEAEALIEAIRSYTV